MEGQGKRLLIAVALALGVMFVWQMIFPSKQPPQDDQTVASGSGSGGAAAVAGAKVVAATSKVCYATDPDAPSEAPTATDAKPEHRSDAKLDAKLIERKFDLLTAKFSTDGGTLVSWQLTDPRYQKDPNKGELLTDDPDHGAFQIGFWKKASDQRCLPRHQVWTYDAQRSTDTSVVFTYTFDNMTFTKTFTLEPEVYLVRMNLGMKVTVEDQPIVQRLAITTYAFQDPKYVEGGSRRVAPRVWSSSTLRDGTIVETPLNELQDGANGKQVPRYEPNITWTGFEHPYLLAAYAPKRADATPDEAGSEVIAKHTYPLAPYGLMRTDMVVTQGIKFDRGTHETTRDVVAYLGPKNYNVLHEADDVAGFPTDFSATVSLGWFAFIGRPLMWLLFQFQALVVNWGLAIILLTFLVKGATLYWTTKSMRSMKQMAALAPQMKALQEKYKGDRQRVQAETMALYKEHNVNPIAGCLPILLQMPIWLALYRMLSNTGELYQQAFIPGWIDDLTNTDPMHVLPIILVVTMFVQARLTPQSGDSRQQKLLQYGMPLMFGVMSFFFPSGLTLYIFTNTVLSALHAIYMNKYDKKTIAIMAQMKKNAEEAKAKAAGNKPDDKDKKAKKPAKPVIDAESKDVDDDDAEPAPKPTRPGGGGQRRKRNKKRRR